METPKMRILLVDDHAIVRLGIRLILEKDKNIEVIGEAKDGQMALKMTEELEPDLIIMDIFMPVLNGVEATRQIRKRFPLVKVLILSASTHGHHVIPLIKCGISGYVTKASDSGDLIKAVHETTQGNVFFSSVICKFLCEVNFSQYGNGLTSRETEVLQLIAEGYLNKEIADKLFLSVKTIEKHRDNLMSKLNIHGVAGLTRYAIYHGLVESLPVSR